MSEGVVRTPERHDAYYLDRPYSVASDQALPWRLHAGHWPRPLHERRRSLQANRTMLILSS